MAKQAAVLVIFQHDLLGEGVAARLRAVDVAATAVRSCDFAAMAAALAAGPDVIVVESTDTACLAYIRQVRPQAHIVDATTSVGRGCPAEAVQFEAILEALKPGPSLPSPA